MKKNRDVMLAVVVCVILPLGLMAFTGRKDIQKCRVQSGVVCKMNMCIPVYPGVNEVKFERWELDSGLYYNKGYDIDYMIPVQGEDDSAALAQKVISFYKGKVINRITVGEFRENENSHLCFYASRPDARIVNSDSFKPEPVTNLRVYIRRSTEYVDVSVTVNN